MGSTHTSVWLVTHLLADIRQVESDTGLIQSQAHRPAAIHQTPAQSQVRQRWMKLNIQTYQR